MMTLRERLFATGEVAINYAEGPANGLAFVLLHGGSARWQYGRDLLEMLADDWHVYAPDFRGHGKSGRVPGAYILADYVRDTAAFLAGVLAEPAVVYGHSLGGEVAVMLAAQHPEVVRAVVVGDAPLSRNQHATEEPDHRAQNVLWHRLAGRPANKIEPTLREMPIRLTVLQYSKWPISSEKATLYECAVHRDAGVLARRAVRRVECRRQAGARRRRRVVLDLREAVAHAVACQCRVVGLDVQSILRVEAVASEEAVDGGAVVVVLVLGWLMRLGLNQQGAGEANLVLVLGNQGQESGELGLFLRQVGVQQGLIAFGPHDVDARHRLAHRALRPDGSKHLRRDVGVRAPHRAVVLSPRALHSAWRTERALRRRREGGRAVGPQ